jgi:hypothetical protein
MKANEQETTDIFLWANQIDAIKNELDVEFFLFNKNYTPYSVAVSSDLDRQIRPLFLYDLINFVNLGAGTGLSVRDYEFDSDDTENILLRTELEKVGRADTLLHIIKNERHDIVEFSEQEHEFKRVKGIVAKFTYKDDHEKTFYVIKAVQQGNVLSGANAWQLNGGTFSEPQADVVFKVPTDNQILVTDEDIFIFNQQKFEKLFNYEYRKMLVVDKKVAEIEKHYRLSFPDGLDLGSLARERKKAFNKLLKLELGEINQQQAIQYADEMQLELMTDDNGAIIIMDGSDLDVFLNLINEDYATNEITGKHYEIKSKKQIEFAAEV